MKYCYRVDSKIAIYNNNLDILYAWDDISLPPTKITKSQVIPNLEIGWRKFSKLGEDSFYPVKLILNNAYYFPIINQDLADKLLHAEVKNMILINILRHGQIGLKKPFPKGIETMPIESKYIEHLKVL